MRMARLARVLLAHDNTTRLRLGARAYNEQAEAPSWVDKARDVSSAYPCSGLPDWGNVADDRRRAKLQIELAMSPVWDSSQEDAVIDVVRSCRAANACDRLPNVPIPSVVAWTGRLNFLLQHTAAQYR